MIIVKLFRTMDRFHWLLLALVAPLLLFPSVNRSPALLAVPVLWLIALMVSPSNHTPNPRSGFPAHQASVSNRCRANRCRFPCAPRFLPATPLNAPLMLLMLMVLVSVVVTPDLAFSLPKVAGMVLGCGVFFATARESERPRGFRLALLLFVCLGVGVAFVGLIGTKWETKVPALAPITAWLGAHVAGLLGAAADGFNPNEVAGALLWVVPVTVCAAIGLLGNRQSLVSILQSLFLGLAALFVLAVLLLTQSRAAYFALALTALVLLFIALPRLGRFALLALLLLALTGAGLYVSKAGQSQVASRLGLTALISTDETTANADPGATAETGNSLDTLQGRVEIWSRAIYGIEDFPFTGMGMNSFRRVVHLLYPLFLTSPDSDIAHAHNEFLQAALDLGLPGLIAFAALYAIAFWMLWRLWRGEDRPSPQPSPGVPGEGDALSTAPARAVLPSPGTPGEGLGVRAPRALALGLAGGLFAHLIYGMVDAVALGAKPGLLFWMLLGIICGLFHTYSQTIPHEDITTIDTFDKPLLSTVVFIPSSRCESFPISNL